MNKEQIEDDTKFVFGKSFSKYSNAEFLESIKYLNKRWRINGFDPKDFFHNKKCLDAGCGNGRGSALMLMNGARWVESIDLSMDNVISTTNNLTEMGYENFDTHQKSLYDLSTINSESYDFVWCNGVVHHALNQDIIFKELARVLKTHGWMWLYLYGKGGIYWYMVNFFREWLKDIPKEEAFKELLKHYLPMKVAEFMDDWYVPILETYTEEDIKHMFPKDKWESIRLKLGVTYDTCMRKAMFPIDRDYMGEGDLRYLLRKYTSKSTVTNREEKKYVENEKVLQFREIFNTLNAVKKEDRLLAASEIQIYLRSVMNEPTAINISHFVEVISAYS